MIKRLVLSFVCLAVVVFAAAQVQADSITIHNKCSYPIEVIATPWTLYATNDITKTRYRHKIHPNQSATHDFGINYHLIQLTVLHVCMQSYCYNSPKTFNWRQNPHDGPDVKWNITVTHVEGRYGPGHVSASMTH